MSKKYTVSKGINNGNLAFAWQLSCDGKRIQWFSNESIARKTCDALTSIELIKKNTKAETVTEFADRCRECGKHFIPISVLEDIEAKIQTLRNCSCSNSDGIIDEVEDIIDKYKAKK